MTTAVDLLAETNRLLKSELSPSLLGDARLTALMAASAVAMVRRELEVADDLRAAEAALPQEVESIRSGAHDDDAGLYERLLAAAVLRAYVADPSGPTEKERRTWIGEKAA